MTDKTIDNSEDKTADNPAVKASDKELAGLIKAQAAEIERLRAENKGLSGLQGEVTKLQETLGTTKALGELIIELKSMAAGSSTVESNEVSDLEKAAAAGDMKAYRKIREAQIAENRPRGTRA